MTSKISEAYEEQVFCVLSDTPNSSTSSAEGIAMGNYSSEDRKARRIQWSKIV